MDFGFLAFPVSMLLGRLLLFSPSGSSGLLPMRARAQFFCVCVWEDGAASLASEKPSMEVGAATMSITLVLSQAVSLFRPKTATVAYIAIAPRMCHGDSCLAELN